MQWKVCGLSNSWRLTLSGGRRINMHYNNKCQNICFLIFNRYQKTSSAAKTVRKIDFWGVSGRDVEAAIFESLLLPTLNFHFQSFIASTSNTGRNFCLKFCTVSRKMLGKFFFSDMSKLNGLWYHHLKNILRNQIMWLVCHYMGLSNELIGVAINSSWERPKSETCKHMVIMFSWYYNFSDVQLEVWNKGRLLIRVYRRISQAFGIVMIKSHWLQSINFYFR